MKFGKKSENFQVHSILFSFLFFPLPEKQLIQQNFNGKVICYTTGNVEGQCCHSFICWSPPRATYKQQTEKAITEGAGMPFQNLDLTTSFTPSLKLVRKNGWFLQILKSLTERLSYPHHNTKLFSEVCLWTSHVQTQKIFSNIHVWSSQFLIYWVICFHLIYFHLDVPNSLHLARNPGVTKKLKFKGMWGKNVLCTIAI